MSVPTWRNAMPPLCSSSRVFGAIRSPCSSRPTDPRSSVGPTFRSTIRSRDAGSSSCSPTWPGATGSSAPPSCAAPRWCGSVPGDVAAGSGEGERSNPPRCSARPRRGAAGRPADRTVFADRDAYVIGSILDAAVAMGDSGAVGRARAALDTLLRRVYARGRAVRHVAGSGSPVRALLEDQVQVAWACLAAREATGEARYLEIAEDLVRLLERDFADSGTAGYFDAAATDPTAPALAERTKPVLDDLLPGGNGWAGRVLLRLARVTGDVHYRRRAEVTLEAFAGAIGGEGLRASSYLAAVQDRKSTRLNSSHRYISYAGFCL